MLPAASIARIVKVWGPSARLLRVTLSVLIGLEKAPPSRLYSKVSPGAVGWKTKVALVLLLDRAGPPSMTVTGFAVSTATVPLCAVELPKALVATTVYV